MSPRYTEEFKIQTVKQFIGQDYSVSSVSELLIVISSSFCNWVNHPAT